MFVIDLPFFAMSYLNDEKIFCVRGAFKYETKKPCIVLQQVNAFVKYLQPWEILSRS
jgi:hypothetical protein